MLFNVWTFPSVTPAPRSVLRLVVKSIARIPPGKDTGIPPGKDGPADSDLLSPHAEALGSTEKIKRQPTLKSSPSSKDPSDTTDALKQLAQVRARSIAMQA
jgi:hypothetical protein